LKFSLRPSLSAILQFCNPQIGSLLILKSSNPQILKCQPCPPASLITNAVALVALIVSASIARLGAAADRVVCPEAAAIFVTIVLVAARSVGASSLCAPGLAEQTTLRAMLVSLSRSHR
jgi:hypothetical protein